MINLSELLPGDLIKLKKFKFDIKFCPVKNGLIQNNMSWDNWVAPSKNLMFIDALFYSKETATPPPVTAMATPVTVTAMATTMATLAMATATLVMAREEFKKTGKIQGGAFLSGSSLIWISHYDLKHGFTLC